MCTNPNKCTQYLATRRMEVECIETNNNIIHIFTTNKQHHWKHFKSNFLAIGHIYKDDTNIFCLHSKCFKIEFIHQTEKCNDNVQNNLNKNL